MNKEIKKKLPADHGQLFPHPPERFSISLQNNDKGKNNVRKILAVQNGARGRGSREGCKTIASLSGARRRNSQ